MHKKSNLYYRTIDKIYKKLESSPLYAIGFAAIIAVTGLMICINLFAPVYKVNDNIAILRSITNDFDVFYMSLLFGRILKYLYNHVANDIPWYGISMLSSLTISLFLITLGIIRNKNTKYLNIPFLIIFLVFYIIFFHQSGFNIASILAGASAVFYFLIYNENNKKINFVIFFLLGVQLALTHLIREQAILAIVAYLGPVLLFFVVKNLKKNVLKFIIFISPLLLIFTVNKIVKHYDVSEEYKYYVEFKDKMHKFQGFPILQQNIGNDRILKANNWTKTDYYLISNFIYYNEDLFNKNTLANVFKYAKEEEKTKLTINQIEDSINSIWKNYKYILFLNLIIIFASLGNKDKKLFMLNLLYFLFVFIFTIYMDIFMRFPSRIGDPILYSTALMLIYLNRTQFFNFVKIDTYNKSISKTFLILTTFVAVSILSVSYLNNIFKTIEKSEKSLKYNEDMKTQLNNSFKDKVIFKQPFWGGYDGQARNVLKVYNDEFIYIPAGWTIYTPQFYGTLNQLGLQKATELLPYAIDNPDVYFLYFFKGIQQMVAHIQNTHGIHCKVEIIQNYDNKMGIFRLHTDDNTNLDKNQFTFFGKNNTK